MDAVLEQLLAQRKLAREAEQLAQRLRVISLRESDAAKVRRIHDIIRRHMDREDRRNDHYWRLLAGKPIVTTAQVASWVRANIASYRVIGGADPVEVAGDVTNALDLWDEHGSIPGWVHGVCEREVARDAARNREETAYRRNFFVEKVINYTDSGDVLFA